MSESEEKPAGESNCGSDPDLPEGSSRMTKAGEEEKPAGHSMFIQHHQSSTYFFSSPLPPAEVLGGYEAVLPGAADRVIRMVEEQGKHRRELEQRNLKADIIKSYLGMACGFTIALYGIYAAKEMVMAGHVWTGALFGFAALGSLVGVFVKSANDRKEMLREIREIEEKSQPPLSKE